MTTVHAAGAHVDPTAPVKREVDRLHPARDQPRAGGDRRAGQRRVEVGAAEHAQPRALDLDPRAGGVLEHQPPGLDRRHGARRQIEAVDGGKERIGDGAAAGLLPHARGTVEGDAGAGARQGEGGGGPTRARADHPHVVRHACESSWTRAMTTVMLSTPPRSLAAAMSVRQISSSGLPLASRLLISGSVSMVVRPSEQMR